MWGAEGYPEVARGRGVMRCWDWGQRRRKSWGRGQAEAEGEVDARGLGRQGRRRACPWPKVHHRSWRRLQGAMGGRPRCERAWGRTCGVAIEGQTWTAGGVSEGRARSCGKGMGHSSVWCGGASEEKRWM